MEVIENEAFRNFMEGNLHPGVPSTLPKLYLNRWRKMIDQA